MNNTTSQSQQPTVTGQPAISPASTLTQVSSVLAIIILFIIACAWLARRLGFTPKRGRAGQSLSVSASCQIGQRERVVIVNVEDARLVLGVTGQHISLLHTLPPAPAEENPGAPTAPADFRQAFQQLLKRPGKPE
ncbi:flagellar biosynthetic protein FliO [Erwinia psidii]|uniref:Flagellar protein n=1 Tax=Erwinia psidii TaxID=69224 RepID=A0A3N6UTN8_9GAMM|nr:flagellar biosynthetic protein FliO [Erwinia psidii]MCX8956320.1 flagellar biosynthetic protein FliO [Erwinia psidii]MCX8959920.1 flagellar biosynthetic protein FliO [Erwinia psidii]MCX8963466.1 flagellar biosynthetic protein FliO [Erwinia psidii]RQM39319.1 flagellar biosynthetic protein FliO [Erwinia psidii]